MEIFQQLDLFTRPIYLRFQNDQIFRNHQGAILSGIVYGLIGTLLYLYTKDVFQMTNPKISNLSQVLKGQEEFDFNSTSLPIAFTFLNRTTWEPFINERLLVPFIVYQELLGKQQGKLYKQEVVRAEICERHIHFKNPGIPKDWLDSLPFGKLYCFPRNHQNIIEGNVDLGTAKLVGIRIQQCIGSIEECQSTEILEQNLNTQYLNIYYTNMNFQPNLQPPFQITGQSLYTTINFNSPKEIQWVFQRMKVESYTGYFLSSREDLEGLESNGGIFRSMELLGEKEILIDLLINLDTKKNIYQVYYQTLSQAMAEVCGAISLLISIFFLIITPIMKMNYIEDFINNIFLIEYHDQYHHDFIEKYLGSNMVTKQISVTDRIIEMIQNNKNSGEISRGAIEADGVLLSEEKESDKRSNLFDYNLNPEEGRAISDIPKKPVGLNKILNNTQRELNSQAKQSPALKKQFTTSTGLDGNSLIKQREISPKNKDYIMETKGLKSDYENSLNDITNQLKKSMKDKLEHNQSVIQLNWKDNLAILFNCCQNSKKSRIYYAGETIIHRDIDIVHIVSKLSEFEKLKKILLNDSQEVMFEFMTKPVMHYQVESNNIVVPNIDFNLNHLDNPISMQKRTQDAFLAYCNIKNQISNGNDQSQRELNQRLLDLIDPKIKQAFQSTHSSLKYINYINKDLFC